MLKKFLLFSLLSCGSAFMLVADEYTDVLDAAQKVIDRKSGISKKIAEDLLLQIDKDSGKTEKQKIEAIRTRFLKEYEKELTPDNIHKIIVIKPLTYTIHSIKIGYDIDSQTQILVSSDASNTGLWETTESADSSAFLKKKKDSITDTGGGVEVKNNGGSILNPLTWLSPKLSYQAAAAASIKSTGSSGSSEIWSQQNKENLRSSFSEKESILKNTRLKGLHFTFSVTFRNNTEQNLVFRSDTATVPVYDGFGDHLLTAKPDKSYNAGEYIVIPPTFNGKNGTTVSFRGDLTTTTALSLLKSMQKHSPDIRLAEGQLFIGTEKGVNPEIRDALHDQKSYGAIAVQCGNMEWNISPFWNKRQITLKEAFQAINSLYEKPPFVLADKACSAFDTKNSDDSFVAVRLQRKIQLFSNMTDEQLNSPLSGDGICLYIVDIDKTLKQKGANNRDDVNSLCFEYIKQLSLSEKANTAVQLYRLGICYIYGIGVSKDYAEAVKWYRKAAEQGLADAQCSLGHMLYYGRGILKDYVEAVKWFRKSAEQGNVAAQGRLGFCYEYGHGVTKDYAEAVKWYRKAAEQGDALGQCWLGHMYEYGQGVAKDVAEAVRWYHKSAEQGNEVGQRELGGMYEYGQGVTQDYTEAAKWYRKSAEQGNAQGQCNLGYMYEYGRGVPQDYAEAVKWYRKSAEQGVARAQCNLGWMYEHGQSVAKDVAEAVKWYRKAAEQGDTAAKGRLRALGY